MTGEEVIIVIVIAVIVYAIFDRYLEHREKLERIKAGLAEPIAPIDEDE